MLEKNKHQHFQEHANRWLVALAICWIHGAMAVKTPLGAWGSTPIMAPWALVQLQGLVQIQSESQTCQHAHPDQVRLLFFARSPAFNWFSITGFDYDTVSP